MEYKHSTLLSTDDYATDGLCDGLPVRVHKWAASEVLGTLEAQKDWENLVCPLQEHKGGLGPNYGFMTVSMPECLPERFEIVSYANEFAFLYDDIVDVATEEEVQAYNDELVSAFNEGAKGGSISLESGKRQMQAKILRKMMELDRQAAMTAMKAWAQFIQTSSGREHHKSFRTLEEYLPYRCKDVGHMFWHALVTFGCDLKIPDHEVETVTDLVMPAVKAASLTNDLFSYTKELIAAKESGKDDVTNGVWVLMKEHDLTEDDAKNLCRALIKEEVAIFVEVVKTIRDRADLSQHARKYVELMQYSVSGNVIWSRECPRYASTTPPVSVCVADNSLVPSWDTRKRRISEAADTPDCSASSTDDSAKDTKRRLLERRDSMLLVPSDQHQPAEDPTELSLFALDPMDDSLITTRFCASGLSSNVVMEPLRYLSCLPSKGVRNKMVDALNYWFEVPSHDVEVVKSVTSLLHSSSLMLDDIEDRSQLRRGKPSTHVIYGEAQTINSATYLYVDALTQLQRIGRPGLVSIFTEEMRGLFIGQSYDIYWTRESLCPSVTEYLQMVDGKTGGLFRMLMRLLQELCPRQMHSDFGHLTRLFARFFQIRDDYQNLASSEYTSMKGFCEDLDEGKYSLPLIHVLHNTPYAMELKGILQQRKIKGRLTVEQKFMILERMKDAGSLDYTLRVLNTLYDAIEAEISSLEDGFDKKNFELRLMVEALRV